ncbi:MAG: hypothetical protein ACRC2R_19075 [Xenococcaceae cyanobacterium]
MSNELTANIYLLLATFARCQGTDSVGEAVPRTAGFLGIQSAAVARCQGTADRGFLRIQSAVVARCQGTADRGFLRIQSAVVARCPLPVARCPLPLYTIQSV